jgi:LysR family transcriptional regulator, regulator for bpeEF and oprC
MRDLNAFATFAAIVDTASFSRAAERLGISKALASKQVAQLEDELGVKLLRRTTRKIGLTTAGELFYERCVEMLAHAEGARHEIQRYNTEPGGLVKVSAVLSFGRRYLVRAIAAFLHAHPRMRVQYESGAFIDLISGRADVVIRTAEEQQLQSLVARKLARLRWVVCAAPSYLQGHSPPQRPEDLLQHNCVVYVSNARGEWVFNGPAGHVSVKVGGNFKANNADAVAEAAAAGVGVAIVPLFACADHIRNGQLVRLLADYELPETTVYAVYLPDRNLPQPIQLFVHFLSQYFGSEPYWDQ